MQALLAAAINRLHLTGALDDNGRSTAYGQARAVIIGEILNHPATASERELARDFFRFAAVANRAKLTNP